MIVSLEGIDCGPVQIVNIGEYFLCWSRCRQFENLHKFTNAYYIGKMSFTEQASETLIIHETTINKEDIPPLTNGTIIYLSEDLLIVEPLNITNIFYSLNSVSDMQLLIADAEGYLPSHEGVAVLSAIGYFPGNITLFNEIRKIPFLSSLDLTHNSEISQQSVHYHEPDDLLMIDRLKQIVPDHPQQFIGMTAGKDCRFVLGIVTSAGKTPSIIHIKTNEEHLVEELADSVNTPLIQVSTATPTLNGRVYTLATDSQIYMYGCTLGVMSSSVNKDSVFHTGIFADLILKDTFKSAVKIPGLQRKIYDKCIHMLLSSVKNFDNILCTFNTYQEIFTYIKKELSFGNKIFQLRKRKEKANWFYYLHRGIRWGNAAVMDLSYFTNVVFLLSDIEAVTYGISSSMWDNFAYDRVLRLNSKLLPNVKTPYAVEVKFSKNPLVKGFQKIQFEYFHRLLVRNKMKKEFRSKSKKEYKPRGFSIREPRYFKNFYNKNFDELMKTPCSYSLKRAAATIAYTLDYLEN